MRRVLAASALAAGVALAASGCGVQATGVHVALPGAISASSSTTSEPAVTPSGTPFVYSIFLVSGNTGLMVPVERTVYGKLDPQGLVGLLRSPLTEQEKEENLHSAVPDGLEIAQTANQHEYRSSQLLNDLSARTQIACTLDLYWNYSALAPNRTTRILPYSAWDDCTGQPSYWTTFQKVLANPPGNIPIITSPLPPATIKPSTGAGIGF